MNPSQNFKGCELSADILQKNDGDMPRFIRTENGGKVESPESKGYVGSDEIPRFDRPDEGNGGTMSRDAGDVPKFDDDEDAAESEFSEVQDENVTVSDGEERDGAHQDSTVDEPQKSSEDTEGESDVPDEDNKDEILESDQVAGDSTDAVSETEGKGLSDEEKQKIKEETGWSDEIIDAIPSMGEYEVYKDAGLIEAEINGKPCLINPNIDMDQKDAFGRTNRERMEQGLAPLDKNGKPIELHHIGQHADSPLAELTQEQHRGKANYSILHDSTKESEIDRSAFDNERRDHWMTRAETEVETQGEENNENNH